MSLKIGPEFGVLISDGVLYETISLLSRLDGPKSMAYLSDVWQEEKGQSSTKNAE